MPEPVAEEVLPESSGTGALLAVGGGPVILDEFDETPRTGRRGGPAEVESSSTGKKFATRTSFGACSVEKERGVPTLDR